MNRKTCANIEQIVELLRNAADEYHKLGDDEKETESREYATMLAGIIPAE